MTGATMKFSSHGGHALHPPADVGTTPGTARSFARRTAWPGFSVGRGSLEIVWAFTMKLSQGFTRPGASVVTLLAMLASFGLLSASMKTLPFGTAYTVWTRIGAV